MIDIFFQFIYQLPFISYYIEIGSIFEKIITAIGFTKILDYDTFEIGYSAIVLKSVTFFLISLQILIYTSVNFKEFIANYLIVHRNEVNTN